MQGQPYATNGRYSISRHLEFNTQHGQLVKSLTLTGQAPSLCYSFFSSMRKRFPWPLCCLSFYWLPNSMTHSHCQWCLRSWSYKCASRKEKWLTIFLYYKSGKWSDAAIFWIFCNFISQIRSLFDQFVCEYKNN